MTEVEETRRMKARNLRYKKPIVKDLNIDKIKEDLWDIQGECEEVRWYTDSEDGTDSLINALDGDGDEAYEFKMAFGDLCAECEQMSLDLKEEWVPDCFDLFFVAIGAGESGGGLLGWDSWEQDYFGLSYTDSFTEDEAKKKLKQMTKDDLIAAARQCFKVYHAYIGLRNRYDSLKAAIDILRNENTGVLQAAERLRGVQIENRPAVELMQRFNNKKVLVYLDPPYALSTRQGKQYKCEMDDTEHIVLLEAAKAHKGPVLISGYDTDLYNDLLQGWHKETTTSRTQTGETRTETLWMNFNPGGQMDIFDYPEVNPGKG